MMMIGKAFNPNSKPVPINANRPPRWQATIIDNIFKANLLFTNRIIRKNNKLAIAMIIPDNKVDFFSFKLTDSPNF